METVGPRRLFRERPDVRLLRLAHPLMRRAASTLHRRLWQPGGDLRRFTIGAAPGLEEPVLIVPAVLTIADELREYHAELLELAFAVGDGRGRGHGPVEADPLPLDDDALAHWRAWLEDRWPDIAPAIEEHRESRRDELEASARDLLPGLLVAEQEAQIALYDRRIRELDEDAGEKGSSAVVARSPSSRHR